jgi:hypothetical protein
VTEQGWQTFDLVVLASFEYAFWDCIILVFCACKNDAIEHWGCNICLKQQLVFLAGSLEQYFSLTVNQQTMFFSWLISTTERAQIGLFEPCTW